MNNKKNKAMWGFSLLFISIVTIIYTFSSILGIELSYILKRVLGVITLIALPILVYSSIKVLKNSKN